MSLENAYLFQEMTSRLKDEISRIALEEFHEKGAFLFHAGDPAGCLYILQEGRVRLSMRGTGHIAHIVSDPGDAIGWSSMVAQDIYTASAECIVPVRVLKFEKQKLAEVLQKDPVGGFAFYKRLAEIIGRRLVASYRATLSVHGDRDPRSYG